MPIPLEKYKLNPEQAQMKLREINLEKYRIGQTQPVQPKGDEGLRLTGEIYKGMAKGLGSSVVGLGELFLKGAEKLPLPERIKMPIRGGIQTAEELRETILRPKTTAEKVGKITEQVGEFLIPIGGAERALGFLMKNAPKTGHLAQLVARAIGSGAEFAGKTAIQTGGKGKEVAMSGGIGFAAPFIGAGVGAIKKAITEKLPESLYSRIFKTAENDLRAYYRSISKGKEVNPTLAREALERGIAGKSENMAVYSFQKLDQLERQVQQTSKQLTADGKVIKLANKKAYVNLLDDISDTFKKGFYSGRAKTANTIKNELLKEGDISIGTILKLRRFLDSMRNTSSFRTIGSPLAPRQAEFRDAADLLRKKLAEAGLGKLMNEERIFIKALDAIIADAAKRQNRNIIGLFDLIAGGGGMVSGNILAGPTAILAVRGFQQPFTLTNLAQALYKLKNIPSGEAMIKAIPPLMTQFKK